MSTGMPELGSKISLISKADIRYEGRLFTVDPQECTIALASVRSFGTEDRETPHPVVAQSQVYDYILFRGSDIKDIRVINSVPTLPNDPAIMQLSMPPSLGQQQFQSQNYSHPVLGSVGPPMGQFTAGYGGITGLASGLAPGMGFAQGPRGVATKPMSVLDLIGGGSRSTTPASLGSRKSPTADQAVQVSRKKDDKRISRPIQPPGRNDNRIRLDSKGDSHNTAQHNKQHIRPNQSQGNQNQGNQQRQSWGAMGRGPARPKGPRSRGPPGGPGNYRQNQQPTGSKPKNTLKFENDYDFEQANTQFEELRSQLEKMKVKDSKPEVNGDVEKKDDSGNETGAGENEPEEEEQVFYDKTKSFFDNISCEAVERSKGRTQRTDWRAERKLNSETFGVSSTRRSGFRGRGFYNRGSSYRPSYRGGGYRSQTNQGNRRSYQDGRTGSHNQQSAQGSSSSSTNQPAQLNASAK